MLDAIENGGMEFIRSLGKEWNPLRELLRNMSLNERRSFCCKILYQRMKEMRLEELEKSLVEPKPFVRETTPLTSSDAAALTEEQNWEEHLPANVRAAYLAPKKLHAAYGVTVAQLQIRGYYLPPVEFMADFCMRAAYYFGLPATGPGPLPRRIERWTVIKSPFIYKKQQENFERRTFSRLVTIKDGHPDVVEMWLSYCVRNMFHGTGMKVNMFTNDYVGVGKTMSQDIKQLVETDRWAVDGYNQLGDDARGLQETIDMEIQRIESEVSMRDNTERAKRVLKLRVEELLRLEGQAEKEAKRATMQEYTKSLSAPANENLDNSPEATKRRHDATLSTRHREAMRSMINRLPELEPDDLQREVEWDKQQDEALRKHLLHVGQYAQQKGIAPLTREEYFVYVPHVLLPKYKGIHKDVFELVKKHDLLRIPTHNSGYLAGWDDLTERGRYDLIMKHRKPGALGQTHIQKTKPDTSRLSKLVQKRRSRQTPSLLESDVNSITQPSNPPSVETASGESLPDVTTETKTQNAETETVDEISTPTEAEKIREETGATDDTASTPSQAGGEVVESAEGEAKQAEEAQAGEAKAKSKEVDKDEQKP